MAGVGVLGPCAEALPALHGDERHLVEEPTLKDIQAKLHRHGLPGEDALWHRILHDMGS